MSHHLRRTLLPVLCATAALGLAACSSGGASTAAAGSGGAASAAASSAAAGDKPLAGTALKSLLLPASAVPAHLAADPSGSRSTGADLYAPSSAPVSAAKACQSLDASSWISAAGIGSASFAQNDYDDSSGDMFAQEIDGFQGGDAKAVMAQLKAVFTKCASFKVKQDGATYTAKLSQKKLSGLGDDAVQAVITSSSWDGGETLVAVRVGQHVVTTMYNDQKTTGSAVVPLAGRLVARVEAAH